MTTELMALGWGAVLGFVHIWLAVRAKTRQYGLGWNLGPRDEETPPLGPVAGRLARAQANFFETFPIMVAAVLIVSVAHLETRWTALGALIWLGGRLLYLPLYAFAVKFARSLAWTAALVGIAMVLWPALRASF